MCSHTLLVQDVFTHVARTRCVRKRCVSTRCSYKMCFHTLLVQDVFAHVARTRCVRTRPNTQMEASTRTKSSKNAHFLPELSVGRHFFQFELAINRGVLVTCIGAERFPLPLYRCVPSSTLITLRQKSGLLLVVISVPLFLPSLVTVRPEGQSLVGLRV